MQGYDMFGIQNLPLFLISCVLLNITPGQDTVYIVGQSISKGRKAGTVSVFGIMSGVLMHTLLAALGLSMILATSSLAFNLVKYVGAGYLIWIGIGFICNKARPAQAKVKRNPSLNLWKTYRQGLLTNLLNPKVALFYLSFLPQFVSPQTEFIFGSFLALGLIFFTTGSIWCMVLVYGSAWLTDKLRAGNRMGDVLKKITGWVFVGIGIKLALTRAE
jgi:RhtB (resistance to homoserine/threonine) family protein